jgi:hypothetical protein
MLFSVSFIPIWILLALVAWVVDSSVRASYSAITLIESLLMVAFALLLVSLVILPMGFIVQWLVLTILAVPNRTLWSVRWLTLKTRASAADVKKEITLRTRRFYQSPQNRWLKLSETKFVYAPRPHITRMRARRYIVLDLLGDGATRVTSIVIPRWKPRFFASRLRNQPLELREVEYRRDSLAPFIMKAIKVAESRHRKTT